MTMDRKKESIRLAIGYLGSMLGLLGVAAFNRYILMSLPLAARMILMILLYWLIALVPILVMIHDRDSLTDYGFRKENLLLQIGIGIGLAAVTSLVFTLLPHLLGFGEYVDSGIRYHEAWKYLYEFVYCIAAVGCVEEYVFRGFLYEKFKRIWGTDSAAVIGSSVLFGLFHILNGSVAQIVITGCLGALFCLYRLKIKNCSTLSLAIMHGVYDALITVWANLLLPA